MKYFIVSLKQKPLNFVPSCFVHFLANLFSIHHWKMCWLKMLTAAAFSGPLFVVLVFCFSEIQEVLLLMAYLL